MSTTTTGASRQVVIHDIRRRIELRLAEISAIVAEQPEAMHLGTWKALDTTVARALIDVQDYTTRDKARREARGGR